MSEKSVKIYIRNSEKKGKVLHLSPTISLSALHQKAAEAWGLQLDRVRLILEGKILENSEEEVELKQKAIVHLVRLDRVELEEITIQVRELHAKAHADIKIEPATTVKHLIDSKLHNLYGYKADEVVMVHIGRQLNPEKSLKEELIEDGAEIVCVSKDTLRNAKGPIRDGENHKQEHQRQQQSVQVDVKNLEAPDSPKEVYPKANFTLPEHQQVQATNKVELVFDPNVKISGSLAKPELEEEQVIPEAEEPKNQEEQNNNLGVQMQAQGNPKAQDVEQAQENSKQQENSADQQSLI